MRIAKTSLTYFALVFATGFALGVIPKELRQQLDIRQASRIEFALRGDHVDKRVRSSPSGDAGPGFGMLKSPRPAVPADFEAATLFKC